MTSLGNSRVQPVLFPEMETFPRLRALGCLVCSDPVSPCPSPACPPELFSEVAQVVYRSVLLSSSHPQLTRQELESKLRMGEIERFQSYPLKNRQKSLEDQPSYGQLPALAGGDSMVVSRRYHPHQKTSPGFFSNLAHLQRQLVSGPSRWSRPIGQPGEEKPSKALSSSTRENTKLSRAPTYGLFPPVLDVWTQHDAMQRSIALRI